MGFPSKNLFLRQELTSRLVRERFGEFEVLAEKWEQRAKADSNFPKHKGRATIYRWLDEGVPAKNSTEQFQVFGLCAMLDVDLLAIFDYQRNGFFSRFSKLRHARYAFVGGMEPVLAMYRPFEEWPSDPLAERFYGRPWFGLELSNEDDWNSTDYMLVRVKFCKITGSQPRAVHIAYRRTDTQDKMWRYYGTVISLENRLELYSEAGHFREMTAVEQDEIRFRTYYGGRRVQWRIASLHKFHLDKDRPYNDPRVIGFEW